MSDKKIRVKDSWDYVDVGDLTTDRDEEWRKFHECGFTVDDVASPDEKADYLAWLKENGYAD